MNYIFFNYCLYWKGGIICGLRFEYFILREYVLYFGIFDRFFLLFKIFNVVIYGKK